jgi:hypothetical protein
MKRIATAVVRTLGLACSVFVVTSADAATPRAYVSVNGNDANTCNVPATPCRTYTGAISQVTPGGVVIVMDSGTFGGGTISQSVTIDAPAGVVALAATPIIVNPGSGNTVVLRGLTFQAATPGSGTGITQQSGRLFVENSVIDGWFIGLTSNAAAEGLYVTGSVFRNQTVFGGVYVMTGSTAEVAIDGSTFERNAVGAQLEGGIGRVSNSVFSANAGGLSAQGQGTLYTVQRCEVSSNAGSGLHAIDNAVLRVSHSTISSNGFGLINGGLGAVVQSYGNNVIISNATNTAGTIGVATLQ